MRWKSRREYAVTQSGLEVLVKGEAWVKFKYGQLTYKQRIKLKTTHEFVESQAAKAVVGQTIY